MSLADASTKAQKLNYERAEWKSDPTMEGLDTDYRSCCLAIVFGESPIALETGTHSPWVSRL
jgi:hypothetical protein